MISIQKWGREIERKRRSLVGRDRERGHFPTSYQLLAREGISQFHINLNPLPILTINIQGCEFLK